MPSIGRPIPVVPAKGTHDGQVQRDRKTVLVPGSRTLAGAERKNVGPGTRGVDLVFAATPSVGTLGVSGWLNTPTDVSADYTALLTDNLVLASGTVTVTLPPVASCANHNPFTVKNVGTGVVTVEPDAVTEVIDGEVGQVLHPYDSMTFAPGVAEWNII